MRPTIPTPARPALADLLLALVVFLTYSSVATTAYGLLDDYPLLASALRHTPYIHDLNESMGRPVAGWIMQQTFDAANSVTDLRWFRLASVLGYCLVAALVRRIATRAGWNLWIASCFALLFVMLPSVQVYVCWTTIWFYPYIIALVAGSLLLLDSALDQSRPRLIAAIVLAAGTFVVVGLTYQPMLFLYIPLFLLRYWTASAPQLSRKIIALHAGTLALAMAACFCVFKFGSNPAPRGAFPTDWPAKAAWFVNRPLVQALNLTSIATTGSAARVLAFIVGTVIIAGSLRAARRGRPRWPAFARVLVLPAALLISYTPGLIVSESYSSFRSSYAIGCTALVAFMCGLHHLLPGHQRMWHACAGAFALVASILAQMQTHTLIVLPQQNELNLLRLELAAAPLKPGDRVLLITPDSTNSLTWIQLYEEFGVPSSSADWVPREMFWLALRDTHPNLAAEGAVTLILPRDPATQVDQVIDLKGSLMTFRAHCP